MKKTHDSLLLVAAVVCCIMIPFFMWAQEGEVKDSHVLPSGFAMKFERMGGYAGTYSSFWIYPDGQLINALGETATIPPDIIEQWLKTITPFAGPPLSGAARGVPSLMGPVCFDCSVYIITIYDKGGTRALMLSAPEVEKTFPRIINRLQRLVWSPLMGAPVEAQELDRLKRQPIKLGGNLLQSRLIRKVEPFYPEQAMSAKSSGKVVLLVTVDSEGNPDVKVVSGDPVLADSAVWAAKQWRYTPTLLNGEPVAVTGTVTVTFSFTASGEPVVSVGGQVESDNRVPNGNE